MSSAALQPKTASAPRKPLLTLELSSALYAVAWLFIVAFHAVCAAHLVCVAMTYWYLTKGTLPLYVSIWSLRGIENYRFYGTVFGVVGGMHAVRVLYIFLLSIQARRLTLRSESSALVAFVSKKMKTSRFFKEEKSTSSRARGFITGIWSKFFSRYGILGVESEHFSTVFALREVLETSSQTYQAYRARNLLPHPGLNALIVALLVTNCWTTAANQKFLWKSPALERVVTLTLDALISFGIMIAIPLIIFLPYVKAFNFDIKGFKNPDFLYDPVALAGMVLENRLVFASGLFDFGTKLIPQLSIILSLVTVGELLGHSGAAVIPGADERSTKLVVVRPKGGGSDADDTQRIASTSPQDDAGPSKKYRHRVIILLFILWGTVIIILHSLATLRESSFDFVGCRAVTRPWFSNGKAPCSSLVYDCNARNTKSLDTSSFESLDQSSLKTLAIVHCSALQMPVEFQQLNSLVMLHMYNSTIVNWDIDSSVSATAHPRLVSVLIGKTQMSEFPPGLLQPLPASTINMQFSETNLKTLPDDLYKRWHALAMIAFENGVLTQIPYQMFFSRVYRLSCMGNQITTIPSLAMMPPRMIIPDLRLKDNPLQELPATLMAPDAKVMSLNVQGTNLTTMPTWVKTQTKVVWAADTPFCATPITDPALAYQVMCFPRPAGDEVSFPMYLFKEMYPFE